MFDQLSVKEPVTLFCAGQILHARLLRRAGEAELCIWRTLQECSNLLAILFRKN
jgi:hypothetical protein